MKAFAYRKGTLAVHPKIDDMINAMKRDGTLGRTDRTYFG